MDVNKFRLGLSRGNVAGGTLYLIVIILVVIAFGAVLTNGVVPSRNPVTSGIAVTPVSPTPGSGNKNLQLYTFGYTTPAPIPPPSNSCSHADGIKSPSCGGPCIDYEAVACNEPQPCNPPGRDLSGMYGANYKCDYVSWVIPGTNSGPPLTIEPYKSEHAAYLLKLNDPNCVGACFGKPVIYLYPTTPTLVDVKLSIPGKVVESNPSYKAEGWKNVLANPNGKLIYQNKTYNELYYESQVDKSNAPKNGIVIASAKLKEKLAEITTKLGLKENEQSEFLEYWLPRLEKLNSPYVLFSLLDPVEKDRVDHVDIVPAPDTRIEFLVYFKAQQEPTTTLNPLPLPKQPPKRIGFTSVEWGGTIAY